MVNAHVIAWAFSLSAVGCLATPRYHKERPRFCVVCDSEKRWHSLQTLNTATNRIMDFKDSIKQIAERIEGIKANLLTEEATKNALIMPFINALGYDVFNPMEVVPEMCCDIGTKKGEKIDYAIMKDGEPIMLIECKHWRQDLNLYDNQLIRYFHVSNAKFGVLTNGIVYRFYTDLAEPNRMDEKPFLEVNLLDLKEAQIEELKKFHKSYFDVYMILSSASELKYMGELRAIIGKEFSAPSPDFVRFFGKQVYDGVFSSKVLEQFTALVKRSISGYISDIIAERLKAAIKEGADEPEQPTAPTEQPQAEESLPDDGIVTTEEELEAFYLIKSLLRNVCPADRITYKDTRSYFGISIDNNVRRTFCRLYLNQPTRKRIAVIAEDKSEVMHKIESINDIYQHEAEIIAAVKRYV